MDVFERIRETKEKGLTKLDLHGCKLAELPKEIMQLPKLAVLCSNGNPLLNSPIEITYGEIAEIRNHFKSLRKKACFRLWR